MEEREREEENRPWGGRSGEKAEEKKMWTMEEGRRCRESIMPSYNRKQQELEPTVAIVSRHDMVWEHVATRWGRHHHHHLGDGMGRWCGITRCGGE